MSPTLRAALAYAAAGWPVVPLAGKRPWLADWTSAASKDPAKIQEWWTSRPNSNVGLVTGARSGFWVLDVDVKAGGLDTLAELEAQHGALVTRRSRTGSGGLHLLFRLPAIELGNRVCVLPGIDVRATGGQIVAPPSVHPDTRQLYTWVDPAVPIADAPAWLLELVRPMEQVKRPYVPPTAVETTDTERRFVSEALVGACTDIVSAAPGGRHKVVHDKAVKLGGYIASGLIDEQLVVAELVRAGEAAGKDSREVSRTVRAGVEAGKKKPLRPALREVQRADRATAMAWWREHPEMTSSEAAQVLGVPAAQLRAWATEEHQKAAGKPPAAVPAKAAASAPTASSAPAPSTSPPPAAAPVEEPEAALVRLEAVRAAAAAATVRTEASAMLYALLEDRAWQIEMVGHRRADRGAVSAALLRLGETFTGARQIVTELVKVLDTREAELVAAAESALGGQVVVDVVCDGTHRMTDTGNAELLVELCGQDLRWCGSMPGDGWVVWDGKRWQTDGTLGVVRRAAEVPRFWRQRAEAASEGRQARLLKWAAVSESSGAVDAMLKLARSREGVPVKRSDFDADPWLLNCADRTLDLRRTRAYPHRRDDLLTKLAGASLTTGACPQWLAFLHTVMGGDVELIAFLQRAVGYSLTGSTAEECLFILHGTGANGKGVFVETLRHVMGDYAANVQFDTFTQARDGGLSPDLATLEGARFVTASEGQEGRPFNEGLVKQLTGEDPLTVNPKYRDPFTFTPVFKVWLSTNHKPVVKGTDMGIWRRLLLVPFLVTVPAEARDKDLRAKLRLEADGILSWALAGLEPWKERGLAPPQAVREATEGYRTEMDVLASFLEDECQVGPGHGPTEFKALYKAYVDWCKEGGLYQRSAKWFALQLDSKGISRAARHGEGKAREGVSLIRKPTSHAPFGPDWF